MTRDKQAGPTTAAQRNAAAVAPLTAALQGLDVPDLYAALGAEVSAAAKGSGEVARFAVTVDRDQLVRGSMSELGERIFKRWSRTLHGFLCEPSGEDADLRSQVLSALASRDVSASALVAGLLVGTFGIAPAIATLIAALVVQLFVKPVTDEICKYWGEQLAAG